MKPYITALSHRPGCSCCISSHGHGYKGKRKNQTTTTVKRAGKKAMRQRLKKQLKSRVENE